MFPWATSAAVHVALLALMAATGALVHRAEMGARRGAITLEARSWEYPEESADGSQASTSVIITPASAEIDHRRYTHGLPRAAMSTEAAELRSHAAPLAGIPQRPREAREAAAIRRSSAVPRRRATVASGAARLPRAVLPPGAGKKTAASFSNPPPPYPEPARAAGIEGTVHLRLWIAADGRVTAVKVVRSSGHDILDGAAVNAVRQWRGEPARIAGIAVETTEVIPVQFKL